MPDLFARITVKEWREFRFTNVEQQRAALLDEAGILRLWEDEFPQGLDTRSLDADSAALRKRPRHGPALPDAHYERVAEVVRRAHAAGQRHTLKAIQDAFGGKEKVSRDMANHWRRRAQQLGYLDPPTPRKRRRSGSTPSTP